MPKDTIYNYTVNSPGSFTIGSTNGTISSIPTSYNFGNDISKGEIGNSIHRVQELQRSEHITMNHNMTVDGTSQQQVGGIWYDVGSPSLHTGQAQRAANMTNKELYSLISNYPDRDNGEPIYQPFPNIEQCLAEAEQITAEQNAAELPTITSPIDIAKWTVAFTAQMAQQVTMNRKKQLMVAAALAIEKREQQIKEQEEYLTKKFGKELYMTLYKAKVEAGAVYTKPINGYTVTTDDVYQAAFSNGKAEKRNAFAAKIG